MLMNAIKYFKLPFQDTFCHVLSIDLRKVEFLVTPAKENVLPPLRTSEFLKQYDLDAAINGDQFTYIDRDHVQVAGYSASEGTVYAKDYLFESTLFISKRNRIQLVLFPSKIYNAISYNHSLIYKKGIVIPHLDKKFKASRTIIGLSGNPHLMYWFVIDGLEGKYGATLQEAAAFIAQYSLWAAINMDGGGSSTMVLKDKGIVNVPADDNVLGRERPVANHLGLRVVR